MKWQPFLAGALRARKRFRAAWLMSLSRRGLCLRREGSPSLHASPLQASRRAAAHRWIRACV